MRRGAARQSQRRCPAPTWSSSRCIQVIFAGLTPEFSDILDRAGIKRSPGRLAYAPDVDTAIAMANVHAAGIGRA